MSGILQTFFMFAAKAGIITTDLTFYYDPANSDSYIGSGTALDDLSTNAYNATLQNGVGFSSGNDGVLTFDGTNDYISMPTASAADFINQSFTVEAWVYPSTSPPSQQTYFSILQDASTQSRLQFRFYSDGIIRFGYFAQDLDTSSGQVDFGSWQHFAMVYNSGDDTSKIYKNGVQLASGNQGPLLSSTNRVINIGRFGNGSEYWKGNIGAIYGYQGAKTVGEINDNFDALKGRYGF
tara:strand:+ start:1167 stop:1877 length:711 start_codon:yes stop_codon:yes gene_type:complete